MPKIIVKTNTVSKGWSTTHPTPIAVCLYRTLTSRVVRTTSRSR